MLSALLTIAGVHLFALMSPGPDFFIVAQTSVSRSRFEALSCVLGITLGVMFWAALSLLGLQWLFERFVWLQRGIMALGGAYLCWLAYLMLKSAWTKTAVTEMPVKTSSSTVRAFCSGLFTNLANAKAVIYFSSVFSLFVSADMSTLEATLIYVLVVAETFLWFSFVALVLSMPKPKSLYKRSSRWIDGICGALFGVFGSVLIYEALKPK